MECRLDKDTIGIHIGSLESSLHYMILWSTRHEICKGNKGWLVIQSNNTTWKHQSGKLPASISWLTLCFSWYELLNISDMYTAKNAYQLSPYNSSIEFGLNKQQQHTCDRLKNLSLKGHNQN